MVGDLPRRLQILVQQRRRHGEGLAGIVEAGRVGGINRELAGDLEVLTGEVAYGVAIFRIAETPGEHDARIAGGALDLLGADRFDEGDDLVHLVLRRRLHRLGRHFPGVQALGHQRPAREFRLHLGEAVIGLDIELGCGRGAAVAARAIFCGKGLHRVVKLFLQIDRFRRQSGGGDSACKDGENRRSHGHNSFAFDPRTRAGFPRPRNAGVNPYK